MSANNNNIKKCNGCKRQLEDALFMRNFKVYARCNDCSKNTISRKNICEVCGIRASFNFPGLIWGRFCSSHKEVGTINIKDPLCHAENCTKRPSFNYEGETTRKFCKDHREIGMINIVNRTCESKGCMKRPTFNFQNESKGAYCKDHRINGMIDLENNRCKYPNCLTQPTFNNEGETKGLFCKKHKEKNMVNVTDSKCLNQGCSKQPIYNFIGEKKGVYCKEHKEENMVNVKDKRCLEPGCTKIPNFNKKGEKKGIYCLQHKEKDMVNVKGKTCEEDGCTVQPTFNIEGEKPKYCEKHRLPGMVNTRDPFCITENCKTRAYYGYCGQPLTHCNQHKLDYMIRKTKRTCSGNDEEDCKECATYGKDEPLHCVDHSLEGEICWLVKRCSNCGRDNELLNKDDLCGICCDKPFYEESKRVNKLKETIMVKYLRNKVKGQEILADRIIDSTCNLYRPDILYDCGTHIVVIECDENQHKNYPWETCSLNKSLEHMEEKRMYEIMVAYGLPAVFIRWNPDAFKVNGVVNKKYNNDKRLEMLIKWVNYCFNKMEVSHGLVYKKLFYDEYQEDDLSFKRVEEADLV